MKDGYKYTIFPSLNYFILNDPKVIDPINLALPVLGDKKNSKSLISKKSSIIYQPEEATKDLFGNPFPALSI
jgi:hypothetical protein